MKQDPRGQIPGIDLAFADGKTGRIWGVSGIDDKRGSSFDKAGAYLRSRAARDGVFDWTITIDLDQVASSSNQALVKLIVTLHELAQGGPGRFVKVQWNVKSGDDNMRSLAEAVKKEIVKRTRALDSAKLIITINIERPRKVRR
jgi:SiaC family regulatory phosphoprotein